MLGNTKLSSKLFKIFFTNSNVSLIVHSSYSRMRSGASFCGEGQLLHFSPCPNLHATEVRIPPLGEMMSGAQVEMRSGLHAGV